MQSINALRPLEFEAVKDLPEPFLKTLRAFFERVSGNNVDDDVVAVARKNLDLVDAVLLSKRGAA